MEGHNDNILYEPTNTTHHIVWKWRCNCLSNIWNCQKFIRRRLLIEHISSLSCIFRLLWFSPTDKTMTDRGSQKKWRLICKSYNQQQLYNIGFDSYLNKYILCFLKAQHKRVGSIKGSLFSLTFAAAEGILLTFLLLWSPWYKAILKNLSLFSTFPSILATLLVCKFIIYR